MKFNAGCGTDTFGDVRLDLVRYKTRFPDKCKVKVTLNVMGSLEHLPFRDNVFGETRCWHVLEHLENPHKGFLELKRVTNGTVHIIVPTWELYWLLSQTIIFLRNLLLHFNHPRARLHELLRILYWKQNLADHKWYIRFRQRKVKKWFKVIPMEYERVVIAKS